MTPGALAKAYGLTPTERERLEAFDTLFMATAAHTNLVSRATLPTRWQRHYADSLQLWALVPEQARTLLDIGAGGGFPGVPLAILAAERRPALRLTLADSVTKKAAFLSEAIAELGLANAVATNRRAETLTDRFDVVTARAVTALPKLLELAVPRLRKGGTMILPKGARAAEELADASDRWRFEASRVISHTDPDATVLVLTEPERIA